MAAPFRGTNRRRRLWDDDDDDDDDEDSVERMTLSAGQQMERAKLLTTHYPLSVSLSNDTNLQM
jgi:hypothetical protein